MQRVFQPVISRCLLIAIAITWLYASGCRPENECNCQAYEDCIDGDCVLKPNTYAIGGVGITSSKVYHGVARHLCFDTLVFTINENASSAKTRYGLWLNVPPVQNVSPTILSQNSEQEFTLFTAAPLCYHQQQGQYGIIDCKLTDDSISMKFKFWTLEPTAGPPMDSAMVTLYR